MYWLRTASHRISRYGLSYASPISARTAGRQEADPGARPLVRARLLSRDLRDVRLRANEPDRRVRRVSPALPALAVRDGVRAAPQAAPLRPGPHLRDGHQQRPLLRLFAGVQRPGGPEAGHRPRVRPRRLLQ